LKRLFIVTEFEEVFGKADSTIIMEETCSPKFENEDDSLDSYGKYLYKNGSRFKNSKDKVLVDEFRFTKNNFILYKGQKLDSSTTISDMEKIFPMPLSAYSDIVNGEQYIILIEQDDNIPDNTVGIFFKNERLYYIVWWSRRYNLNK